MFDMADNMQDYFNNHENVSRLIFYAITALLIAIPISWLQMTRIAVRSWRAGDRKVLQRTLTTLLLNVATYFLMLHNIVRF